MRIIHFNEQDVKDLKNIELDLNVNQESLNDKYVECFVKCLERNRQTSYDFVSKPDKNNRQSPQPDYLFREHNTEKYMAVEYTTIYESEINTKTKAFIIENFNIRNKIPIIEINPPTPSQLAKRLTEFFVEKLSKGQFNSYSQSERILLCRNLWTDARLHHFTQAQPLIKKDTLINLCNHIYVIIHTKVLEIY